MGLGFKYNFNYGVKVYVRPGGLLRLPQLLQQRDRPAAEPDVRPEVRRGDDRRAKRYIFQPPGGLRWALLKPLEDRA